MEHLQINTTQNVNIEQSIASIGGRMLAHGLDYLVFLSYFFLILFITNFFSAYSTTASILLFLPIVLYDLIFEYFFNGQSIGKKIARIKVVKMDGSAINIGDCLIRWIFRIVDNVIIWGAISTLTIIINGKGQRLGDIAAGTTVIRILKKVNINQILLHVVPDNYQVVFEGVKHLQESDINTIKEVILFYKNNPYNYENDAFGFKTKKIMENKLNIQSNLHPIEFLNTIIKDYNYFNR